MLYLTLAADYHEVALRDGLSGDIEAEAIIIPSGLMDEIRRWNDRYQVVIPLSLEERALPDNAQTIQELDRQGLVFASRIESALRDQSKVRYYSEGRLKYLS